MTDTKVLPDPPRVIVSVTITDSRETEISGAIRSVVDQVDRVLVVDTGVTDRTLERAKDAAGSKLSVATHDWVDFATARNAGLEEAVNLGATWIVIVDSDERMNFGALDLRNALQRTRSNVLLVESDDNTYPKEKIIRAKTSAHFYGPTHEALIGGGTRELLRGATFHELPKTDAQFKRKFERDVALLTAFIAKHPGDPRWYYYLGESLEGLGLRAQSADAFGQCARLRKVGYEAAWASFKQAEQLLTLDRYGEAIEASARGLVADATFAECACVAAEAALKAKQKTQAIAWARIAEAIGRYKGSGPERLWFRDLPSLYERPYVVLQSALSNAVDREKAAFDFHEAKAARVRANTGNRDLDWLSVSRSAPELNREEARAMLRPLTLGRLCPSAKATRIQFEPPGGRLPTNPSICRHRGEIWCVIRTINYTMSGRQYTVHDPYGIVRTENYLGRLKPNGMLVDPVLMRDLDPTPKLPSRVVGYEDVRLVSLKEGLAGSATVCDREKEIRIVRMHLDARGNVKRADVQPSNQPCEKNWMPLSVDGRLTWIYSLDPTAILPGPLRHCPLALDHIRGGAAIAFGSGYLCVVHETIDRPEGRIYLHRFAQMDKRFNVTAVSQAWVFAHHGIEFCAGIVHAGKQIVLSYGLEDREAWVMRVDVKEIKAMKWIAP